MIRATLRLAAKAILLLSWTTALLVTPVQAQQGESAIMKRAAELRESASETSRSVAALPAQEALTRLGDRQGAWIRVQTHSGLAGWVHMFDVGPAGFNTGAGTAAPTGGNPVTGGLRGISNLLRGGSATQPQRITTPTIGIRGLEAEDLARAQPNLNAVGQMEQLRLNEAGARQFASEAALVAADVPALPAPTRGRAPSQGGATGNPNPLSP